MQVEVCCNSLESALNAEKAGADRIELCSELGVGGITPSYGLLKSVKEKISIPVHVLIRPRSGDFTYSDGELEIMKTDIALCIDLGFEGIVAGILSKDFSLDLPRTDLLVKASRGLKFTFHRAFDWVKEPQETLKLLEDLGIDYILSSGQKTAAIDGIDLLTQLHQKATSIVIMPGGGVRLENIHHFKEKAFQAVHFTGTQFHKTLTGSPKVSMNSFSFLKEDQIAISNQEVISAIIKKAK